MALTSNLPHLIPSVLPKKRKKSETGGARGWAYRKPPCVSKQWPPPSEPCTHKRTPECTTEKLIMASWGRRGMSVRRTRRHPWPWNSTWRPLSECWRGVRWSSMELRQLWNKHLNTPRRRNFGGGWSSASPIHTRQTQQWWNRRTQGSSVGGRGAGLHACVQVLSLRWKTNTDAMLAYCPAPWGTPPPCDRPFDWLTRHTGGGHERHANSAV